MEDDRSINETSPYPVTEPSQQDGIINFDYIRSMRGMLNFAIVGLLFLGFVSAVSLTLSNASIVDRCLSTGVKVNVEASNVAYMFFAVLTLVIFAVLALLNSIQITMFSTVRAILSKMITVALVLGLGVILFIVSSTQCAAEHKLGKSRGSICDTKVRPGGPGASCFFGYASLISMMIFAAMTFME